MIKTVTLSGTEVKADGLGGFNTVVHNMSSGTVYASKHPDISAGADDVAEIPAGAVKLISSTNGKVYLVGNGKVELTGQDDYGVNCSSSAASAVVVGGSGVTEQFVTEQDALNLKAAKSYADGILEAAKNSLEQQLSQSSDRISQIDGDISELRSNMTAAQSKIDANTAAIADNASNITAADEKAENALTAVEKIADKSVVSEDGAFDLRFYDAKLQAKVCDNWSDITTGVGEGGVSQAYVDSRDAASLAEAKEYTDSKTAETLETARAYADAKASEATDGVLEAAKTYTDAEIGAVKENVSKNSNDISALQTDLVQAQATANAAQTAADEAKETADAAVQSAKEYTDTVAADKADKPVNAFVLIQTTNWESDDNTYPYYYDIPIEGVTSADRADVFFAADSEEAAKKCGFGTGVTTSDGAVKIRAKHIPETVLSANVQIGLLAATNTLHIGADGGTSAGGGSIDEHNADPEAHPDLRAYVNELKGRIVALEVAAGGEVNANPFAVTFGDLDGVIANGVWVPALARLEF